MNPITVKDHCPTCGHVIAQDRLSLSSIQCRRYINSITHIDSIIGSKDYLVRFIRSSYRIKEFADKFLDDLESKINNGEEVDAIKIWILDFINKKDCFEKPKEIGLYRFLYTEYYFGINEPFSIFYEKYTRYIDNPMSRNQASRALSAFGLKTAMKKNESNDGKMKCTIMLCASKEELVEIFRKNGFS